MNGLIRASLRNAHAVTVFCLTLVLFGAVSVYLIPIDILPVFKSPAVQVLTFYTGMPASSIEKDITQPDGAVGRAGQRNVAAGIAVDRRGEHRPRLFP